MKTYSMEEEIKQKLELGFNPKYAGATNDLLDLISQALQKRDEAIIEEIIDEFDRFIPTCCTENEVEGDCSCEERAETPPFIRKKQVLGYLNSLLTLNN